MPLIWSSMFVQDLFTSYSTICMLGFVDFLALFANKNLKSDYKIREITVSKAEHHKMLSVKTSHDF